MVSQISVFLENKSGRLAEVCKLLGEAGVNIRALSLADTLDFGILRLIVNAPKKALKVLRGGGFTVKESHVLVVEVHDEPGGLSKVLGTLSGVGVNVEYMYAFVEKSEDKALVVFRVQKPEAGAKLLSDKGVKMVTDEEIERI